MSSTNKSSASDYTIFGINFKDFLDTGVDLSGIIDTVGGSFNFEITLGISCIIIIISSILLLLFTTTKKTVEGNGLTIPGIGKLGSQQPLIIQMPMQTASYPFFSSPFPRDT